ncbi:hypothetical protein [Fodinibius halophilus]|uniref:Uncharacterized protein n=1 Tax=Fodinibius halophilus TaxID=1736908 RepID=A0A6M1STM3_9BACT|nr:hypothetical protein [Fodinibius halophilus]NGP87288.1 hypothetical protein [Fodinibius halophilus]
MLHFTPPHVLQILAKPNTCGTYSYIELEAVADFFGKFASQALEESGYLINRLADRFA